MRESFENGKIFVGGLSQDTTKETMRHHFADFGNITDCVVMLDKGTNRSRGFGFVTFDNTEAIDSILASKQIIDGKEVDCKRACPRESLNMNNLENKVDSESYNNVNTDKIFVGGLPDVTTEEFRQYFEKFGKVTNVVLMTDKSNNRPRGFGFITFEDPKVVEEVVRQYSSHLLRGKWVEVKKATPKEQMNKVTRDNLSTYGFHGGNPIYSKWNHNGYDFNHRINNNNIYGLYGNTSYYDTYQGLDGYDDNSKGRYEFHQGSFGKNIPYNNHSNYTFYNRGSSNRHLLNGDHSNFNNSLNNSNFRFGNFNNNGQFNEEFMLSSYGPQRGSRSNFYGRTYPY